MIVRENISLAALTTLRVGGAARFVLECSSREDLIEATHFIHEYDLPFCFLGQGSNICADDTGYDGIVVAMREDGYEFVQESTAVVANAGASWDALVSEVSNRGMWGMENLAGIPGTVGAAPVQNIGAYGMDVSQSIEWVDTFNMRTQQELRLSNAKCAFAYRDSIFKRIPELAITRVSFRVAKEGAPHIAYKDLQALDIPLDTPKRIADAVRRIRSVKFPDVSLHGTAGSFFKNPIISEEQYNELLKTYPDIPTYPDAKGIKIPLAWILDNVLHMKGFALGPVTLFERQPLVLVTNTGATSADVDAMSSEVMSRVHDATHIAIEREVRSLSKTKI